jgi:hypothetical protein
MPFTASTLYKVGGAEPGLWLYTNADAIATVVASGYFNTVTDSIKRNDVILAVTSVGGTTAVDALVVTSATGAATVTTTNGT